MSMVEFKGVIKRFGSSTVLSGITVNVDAGEVVVVVGTFGSGKFTFLRCINVLETIDGNDLRVDGISMLGTPEDVRTIRREASMVFQQFNLFPQMTALENVFGPVHTRGAGRDEAWQVTRELLGKVGLSERMDYYPAELWSGQQQRVAIARALAIKPKLMLFDEPTRRWIQSCAMKCSRSRDLAEEGVTMIVVTHEWSLCERSAAGSCSSMAARSRTTAVWRLC